MPGPDYEWSLRLFVSVDIVDSTALKARKRGDNTQHWADLFRLFFQEFPDQLRSQYNELPAPIDPLRRWKYNGDEILFAVELKDHRHAWWHLEAVVAGVQAYEGAWDARRQAEPDQPPLLLKVAAWVAGFPVSNTHVELKASDREAMSLLTISALRWTSASGLPVWPTWTDCLCRLSWQLSSSMATVRASGHSSTTGGSS